MYQTFIIQYLYEAQYVSGDTPPIIRNLKLHWQPLVFHTLKVVGRVVCGHCQAQYVTNKMQQCINILLFYIFMKLNMFRATHRPSSVA
jgi:hypothetical protein